MLSAISAADCGSPPSSRTNPAGVSMSTALNPLTPTYQLLPNSRNGVCGWFHSLQESQAMGVASLGSGTPASGGAGAVAARAAASEARAIKIVVTTPKLACAAGPGEGRVRGADAFALTLA